MNVLIIEDDEFLANCIKNQLSKKISISRFRILSSYSSYLQECHRLGCYDVVLIDIFLKGSKEKNGIDIIKHIRTRDKKIPIIVISWLQNIKWLQDAFREWANDYVTKPFRVKELEIRIMRHYQMYLQNSLILPPQMINYEDLTYDTRENIFFYKWEIITLTKTQKHILSLFIQNQERLLSENYLKEKIWWDISWVIERNLKIHMFRLKVILSEYWLDEWVVKVRWEWYIFKK